MPPHRNFAVDDKVYLEDEKTLPANGQTLSISKTYLWKRTELQQKQKQIQASTNDWADF